MLCQPGILSMYYQGDTPEKENPVIGDFFNKGEKKSKPKPTSLLLGIDLNLLVALEALLICRNVTHAAHRLGQTQPAVSRALAKLRDLLGDDILVRSSTGMKLTARGEYLQETVPAAMKHVRDLVTSRSGEAEMRVSVSSGLMPIVLPYLFNSKARNNETVTIGSHKSQEEAKSQLHLKTADLVLGTFQNFNDGEIKTDFFFREGFVTLVTSNFADEPLTEERFLQSTHISIVENGVQVFPQTDEALFRYGVRKPFILEMSDIMAAALLVSERNLTFTVPRSIAGWLSRTLPLSAFIPPIEIAPQKISTAWAASSEVNLRHHMISNIKSIVHKALKEDQALVNML